MTGFAGGLPNLKGIIRYFDVLFCHTFLLTNPCVWTKSVIWVVSLPVWFCLVFLWILLKAQLWKGLHKTDKCCQFSNWPNLFAFDPAPLNHISVFNKSEIVMSEWSWFGLRRCRFTFLAFVSKLLFALPISRGLLRRYPIKKMCGLPFK